MGRTSTRDSRPWKKLIKMMKKSGVRRTHEVVVHHLVCVMTNITAPNVAEVAEDAVTGEVAVEVIPKRKTRSSQETDIPRGETPLFEGGSMAEGKASNLELDAIDSRYLPKGFVWVRHFP